MQDPKQSTTSASKPLPTPSLWIKAPPELQAERLDTLSVAELIRILKDPKSTEFEKAKSCQRLAVAGTPEAVPALAALLPDERLGVYARFGLEPINHASVDDALRSALAQAKGAPLVGVINSIRVRKDAKAAPALVKLLSSSDAAVAEAAAWALGAIGGLESAKALRDALGRSKGALRMAIGGAGLTCAEALLAQGARSEALALYEALSRPDIPKPVRLAAMQGTIAAEISLSRPR
jgi:HEAT repeat protein